MPGERLDADDAGDALRQQQNPGPGRAGPGRAMPKGGKRELRPQPLLDLAAARAAVRAGAWKEEPHLRRLLSRLLRASRAGSPAAGVAAVAGELGLPQGMAAALDADFAWLTRCVGAAAPRSGARRPAGTDAGVLPNATSRRTPIVPFIERHRCSVPNSTKT